MKNKIAKCKIKKAGRGIFCGGPMFPTAVVKNQMQNCIDGFMLNYGFIGPQGAVNNPGDNEWWGQFAHHTLSYYSNGDSSAFFVRKYPPNPFWSQEFYPVSMQNQVLPYYQVLLYTPVKINSTTGKSKIKCVSPFKISLNIQIAKQIIQENIQFPIYNTESKKLSKFGLYKYLLSDSVVVTDPLILQFKQQSHSGTFGKFLKVDSLLQTGDFTAAQTINSSVNATDIVETTLKIVNDIFIANSLQQNEVEGYSESNKNILRDIARQCPYEYGNGVYIARMLLGFVDTTEYVNSCEIYTPYGSGSKILSVDSIYTDNNLFLLSVHPNPSDDEVIFETHSDNNFIGLIEIYNMIGNKLFNIPLNDGLAKHTISFNNYSSGLYYYKLTQNGEVIKKDILIIIK